MYKNIVPEPLFPKQYYPLVLCSGIQCDFCEVRN
jgi:hypothetical protein